MATVRLEVRPLRHSQSNRVPYPARPSTTGSISSVVVRRLQLGFPMQRRLWRVVIGGNPGPPNMIPSEIVSASGAGGAPNRITESQYHSEGLLVAYAKRDAP